MFRPFKHTTVIAHQGRGTIDKCREELEELIDADKQRNPMHVVIEAADLINSTYTFVWRHYRIPFFIVIMIAMMTGVYKPIVRWWKRTFWSNT